MLQAPECRWPPEIVGRLEFVRRGGEIQSKVYLLLLNSSIRSLVDVTAQMGDLSWRTGK